MSAPTANGYFRTQGPSRFMPTSRHGKYSAGLVVIVGLFFVFASSGMCLEPASPRPEDALCVPYDHDDGGGDPDGAQKSADEEDGENLCTATRGEEAKEDLKEESFIDLTHGYLARGFSAPTVWFDSFFGDQRILEEGPPGTFIRWRNALRWSETGSVTFRTKFSASLRLPKMKKKLRLVVAGDNTEDAAVAAAGGTVDPLLDTTQDQKRTDVGLLYDLFDRRKAKFDIGANVRLRKPVQPFVRARYRYTQPFGSSYLARLSETIYWFTKDGFSETTRLDLEHAISAATVLRLSNSVTYAEAKVGVDWTPELSYFWQLSPKDAISFDISAWMVTRPQSSWQNFRVGTRYRRNILRPWFFYEIEPEITWPRNEFGDQTSVTAITFLIEVQFSHF